MKMIVTVREILDKGLWPEYCALTGTNEWAVNEGLMKDTEEVELPIELQHYFLEQEL